MEFSFAILTVKRKHPMEEIKRLQFLVCLIAVCVGAAAADSKFQEKLARKLPVVCDEPNFSFGKTSIGQRPRHDFILKNNTGNPLTIASVDISCGCALAKAYSKTLPENGQAKISVSMNTAKFRGKKTSSIHVRYKEIDFESKLSVDIDISNLEITPDVVSFKGGPNVTGKATEKFTVRRVGSPYWTVKQIETSSKELVVNSDKRVIAGNVVTFHLTCNWFGITDEVAHETITLHTNDSATPKVSIPVRVYPSNTGLICSVKKLNFDLASKGTKRLLFASIKSDQIQSVTCDNPAVTVRAVAKNKPGKAHFVTVDAVDVDNVKLDSKNSFGKIIVMTKSGGRCEVAIELTNTKVKH